MAIIGISKISVSGSNPGVPAMKIKKYFQPLFVRIKKIKPKVLLSLPLALLSLEVFLGALSGYFLANYLSAKEAGQKNRWWRSFAFEVGNYRLHFHHWLYGLAVLIPGLYYSLLPFPQLSLGFLGGAIFQGIYRYRDWYKVITKQKK